MPTYQLKSTGSDVSPWSNNRVMQDTIHAQGTSTMGTIPPFSEIETGFITVAGEPNSNYWESGGTWEVDLTQSTGYTKVKGRCRVVRLDSSGSILQSGDWTAQQTMGSGVTNTFNPVAPSWTRGEEDSTNRIAINCGWYNNNPVPVTGFAVYVNSATEFCSTDVTEDVRYQEMSETASTVEAIVASVVLAAMVEACGTSDNSVYPVAEERVYCTDVVNTSSYHPLEIPYTTSQYDGFLWGNVSYVLNPISDLGGVIRWTRSGASTYWQCVSQDPTDTSDVSYITANPIVNQLFLGLSSLPNTTADVYQIDVRFRAKIFADGADLTLSVAFEHPADGELFNKEIVYTNGTDKTYLEEFTETGFLVPADVFNDRTSYISFTVGLFGGASAEVTIYAVDITAHASGVEKIIPEDDDNYTQKVQAESWTEKGAGTDDFGGEKTIGHQFD